jgi:hypothetical protein
VSEAAHGVSADPHATWTVRGCDSVGLILDFRWTGGFACPAIGLRWFSLAGAQGWRVVYGTTAHGRAGVQKPGAGHSPRTVPGSRSPVAAQ